MKKALKVDKLDCLPLLWCQQEKQSMKWTINIAQAIACKYFVVKLIDRHPGSSAFDANIDMFPL